MERVLTGRCRGRVCRKLHTWRASQCRRNQWVGRWDCWPNLQLLRHLRSLLQRYGWSSARILKKPKQKFQFCQINAKYWDQWATKRSTHIESLLVISIAVIAKGRNENQNHRFKVDGSNWLWFLPAPHLLYYRDYGCATQWTRESDRCNRFEQITKWRATMTQVKRKKKERNKNHHQPFHSFFLNCRSTRKETRGKQGKRQKGRFILFIRVVRSLISKQNTTGLRRTCSMCLTS